jgi:hypothetical protein
MDFWELLKILARRWVVVIPILVTTGLTLFGTQGRIQPEYRVELSVILLTPSPSFSGFNPFVTLGTPATAQTLKVTAYEADSRASVAQGGHSADYDVVVPSRSPLITVMATADTPQGAITTAERVSGLLQSQLAQRQKDADVAPAGWITIQRLTQKPIPVPITTGGKRLLFVIGAGGVGLTILAALLLEGGATLRRQRIARRRSLAHLADEPMPQAQTAEDASTDAPAVTEAGPRDDQFLAESSEGFSPEDAKTVLGDSSLSLYR